MAKHRSPLSRRRRWAVPVKGVRSPQPVGWKAFIDLDPGEFLCVQWLLRGLMGGKRLSPRDLAQEVGIRMETAVHFLHSEWVLWAKWVLHEGNGPPPPQVMIDPKVASLRAALRETMGNEPNDPQSVLSEEVVNR